MIYEIMVVVTFVVFTAATLSLTRPDDPLEYAGVALVAGGGAMMWPISLVLVALTLAVIGMHKFMKSKGWVY
jgi:hypothetical protein